MEIKCKLIHNNNTLYTVILYMVIVNRHIFFGLHRYEYEYEYKYLYFGNINDMAMKRKFIIYAPGNRNYRYCRLHFGYQIIIYIYIYKINDRNFEINVD